MAYVVYILRCKDQTLYTGITNDLAKRLQAHRAGKGAKYTASHPPEAVVYTKRCRTRGAALRCEIKIKNLTRAQKLVLIGM
jgi:putative endonuclease